MITDTHTHLYSEQFDDDRDAMISRAKNTGVSRFFIPAIDSSYTERMFDLEKNYPNDVYLMMGLHPTSVKENYKEELAHVKEWIDKRDFYAIGEIGIDLYWDKSFLQQQQEAFRTQIQWAKEKKLPIVIHCRDAFDEIFEVLEAEKGDDLRGIFHCFTGTLEQAKKAISYNMKLGIGGVVTFKNGKIDTFLNEIDLEHIVLETDSPYLAPTPYRGKRNESSYIEQVVGKLVDIYGNLFKKFQKLLLKILKKFLVSKTVTAYYKSPIGSLEIRGNNKEIYSIYFIEENHTTSPEVSSEEIKKCISQLDEYFSKQRKEFAVTLKPKGTAFQGKVWTELLKIPFGKTRSYMEQSKELGDIKAIRAVASANGKNPISIIIPCHRIIGSDGSLTGYAGGIWRKKWLLEHESGNKQQSLF